MTISRKDFFKKVCISGACLCGFSTFAASADNSDNTVTGTTIQDPGQQIVQDWISDLLASVDSELDEELKRKILKKLSRVHFNNLKMDEMLSPYIGDLDKFIGFIEEKWGWKIDYDRAAGTLIADENKNYCVCPVSVYKKGINSSAMCYCSEGFAEKMFSAVAGVSVSASVISSIRRGNDSCKYKIEFS